MGARTMGTVLLLMAVSGLGSTAEAQRPHATVGVAVRTTGPRGCTSARARPARARRACAVPRRGAAVGRGYAVAPRWVAVDWGSAWAWGPTSRHGRLEPGHLKDALGRHDYKRLRNYVRNMGFRGRLTGVWIVPRYGAPRLEVASEGFVVARLLDRDRDGWTDLTQLRRTW